MFYYELSFKCDESVCNIVNHYEMIDIKYPMEYSIIRRINTQK